MCLMYCAKKFVFTITSWFKPFTGHKLKFVL